MSFPKHSIIKDNNIALKNLQGKDMRYIGFAPMFFCEFFQGMEVIQMQGKVYKEYIFGIYFDDLLIGHCYFGNTYTPEGITELVKTYLPSNLKHIKSYVLKNKNIIWYNKFDMNQYAWIYDRVITPVGNTSEY